MPTLRTVLRAFPRTPLTIEIKARTRQEETAEYVRNATTLAKLLRKVRRRDIIVASFRQQAVDRFHELAPEIALAPGIDGAAGICWAAARRAPAWRPSSCRSRTSSVGSGSP